MDSTRTDRIRLLTAVVAFLMLSTGAWAQNLHAGVWEARELTIKEAAPGCRYVESVTAVFQLSAGINNTVDGSLTRRFARHWWTGDLGCRLPGAGTNPLFTLRQDNWQVHGEPLGRGIQRLTGKYIECTTDCHDPWSPPLTFAIDFIRRDGGGMSAGLLKGISGVTEFRDSYLAQLDSAEASEAYMPLIRPLIEGKCDEFLLRSVDAGFTQRFPRDALCALGTQYRQLMPNLIRSEKTQAYSVSLALITGAAGPILLSGGDVLVQRFFVLTSDGNGLFMGAALRKQGNGSWKLADVVP